jgi:hypothetical protein
VVSAGDLGAVTRHAPGLLATDRALAAVNDS